MLKVKVRKLVSSLLTVTAVYSSSFFIESVPKSEAFIGFVVGRAIKGAIKGDQMYRQCLEIGEYPIIQHNMLVGNQEKIVCR